MTQLTRLFMKMMRNVIMKKDKIWRIYKYTNIVTGQSYIGLTTQNVNRRFGGGGAYKKNTPFRKAIDEYGPTSFEQSILRLCTTEEEAEEYERYFIEKFNTLYPNGYNVQLGGIHGTTMSQELRKKISDSVKNSSKLYIPNLKGIKRSDDFKKKVSEGVKRYYAEVKGVES